MRRLLILFILWSLNHSLTIASEVFYSGLTYESFFTTDELQYSASDFDHEPTINDLAAIQGEIQNISWAFLQANPDFLDFSQSPILTRALEAIHMFSQTDGDGYSALGQVTEESVEDLASALVAGIATLATSSFPRAGSLIQAVSEVLCFPAEYLAGSLASGVDFKHNLQQVVKATVTKLRDSSHLGKFIILFALEATLLAGVEASMSYQSVAVRNSTPPVGVVSFFLKNAVFYAMSRNKKLKCLVTDI